MTPDLGKFHGVRSEMTPDLGKFHGVISDGAQCEKICFRGFANNTSADQPVHPRSLISAFVIRILESIICNLATGEISIF